MHVERQTHVTLHGYTDGKDQYQLQHVEARGEKSDGTVISSSSKNDAVVWPKTGILSQLDTVAYDYSGGVCMDVDGTETLESPSTQFPSFSGSSSTVWTHQYGDPSSYFEHDRPAHISPRSGKITVPSTTPCVKVFTKKHKNGRQTYRFDNGEGKDIDTEESDWQPAIYLFGGKQIDCLAYTGKKSGKIWFTWCLPE